LFDDRVEISNPGGLLASVGKEFGHKSVSRNPLIFSLFQRMHLVEKVGSGILRMEEMMLANHLPAPIYQKEGLFTITFKRPVVVEDETSKPTDETVQKSSEKSSEKGSEKSSEKILKLIERNNFITISELAEIIGISTRAIEKQINRLQIENKIIHVGPDKGGHWDIVVNANTVEKTVVETVEKTEILGDKLGDKSQILGDKSEKLGNKSDNKTKVKIIDIITKNNLVTISELAKILGITYKGIQYHINAMKKEGIITRVGSRKTGYWSILANK
jgi:predicted HTH transcriptional regulator